MDFLFIIDYDVYPEELIKSILSQDYDAGQIHLSLVNCSFGTPKPTLDVEFAYHESSIEDRGQAKNNGIRKGMQHCQHADLIVLVDRMGGQNTLDLTLESDFCKRTSEQFDENTSVCFADFKVDGLPVILGRKCNVARHLPFLVTKNIPQVLDIADQGLVETMSQLSGMGIPSYCTRFLANVQENKVHPSNQE